MINQIAIFREYLKSRDLRFTPERRLILEAILSLPGHFNIEGLYYKLHRKMGRLSLATIYRSIPHLINSGLIKEVMRYADRPQYEKSLGCPHHGHLVCINCGKILEFKDDEIEKLQDRVCREYDFKPTEHRLGIRGYCKNCRHKKGK
ncbi:MAG: transcriptional repressor [Candidatus Omnitrophica bacterium]|nr:transcriptional repressor [Candidatus Omnitrophota bacterium]